ncbi:acyl carrier protein [Agarilytica rhodophyticola]|uniref:acyl carrier protein n=1 Tax=Agarilytica rhodophyticola TaxID=1737490 RepID=UPI000B3446B5|nr:acyl carrier protein [Agarilytica rhodophyticola]
MDIKELENAVILCLQENLELSGEPVPPITKHTKPASDLSGFDSLRTIEVLISLEDKVGCDLPPDKLFAGKKFEELTVSSIAQAIDKVNKGSGK